MIAFLFLFLPAAALWPWLRTARRTTALYRLTVAIGLGFGFSSTTFFAWRMGGGNPSVYPMIEAPLWLAVGAAGIYVRARSREIARRVRVSRGVWTRVWAIVILALSAWLLTEAIRANPNGAWDAWAIWNLRAKFLAAPSGEWRHAFDAALDWSQRDYPLLLPLTVARGWVIAHRITVTMPVTIAAGFAFAAILAVSESLLVRRGARAASIGLALTAAPAFVLLGGSQLADVPLAFYAIAAVTLLDAEQPDTTRLLLAGAAMGFAAWTKNEGLLVAIALPVSYVIATLRQEGRGPATRAAIRIAIGLIPVLVVVAIFKTVLAPPNDLVVGILNRPAWAHWTDASRVWFVSRRMAAGALSWGGWPIGGPVWLLALVAIAGFRTGRSLEPAVAAAGVVLVVQFAAFFCVYVMTPYDVAWHIDTSWSRLIAQAWPMLVWWIVARSAPPSMPAVAPISV